LLGLADSLKLSDDEVAYRQYTQGVQDYFDTNLFGLNRPNAPTGIDLPRILQGQPTNTEPTDEYPEDDFDEEYPTDTDDDVDEGEGSAGDGDYSGSESNYNDYSGSGDQDCPRFDRKPPKPNWGGSNNSPSYYEAWSPTSNFYNYSSAIGTNNSTGGPGSGTGGSYSGGGSGSSSISATLETIFGQYVGTGNLEYEAFFSEVISFMQQYPNYPSTYTYGDILDLAIDCYNAPFNDYIVGSNMQNCMYEYFFVNDPPPTPTPDIPQTFAQLVLADPTAANLVDRLEIDIELEIEYINYLEQHPDILQAILGFVEAHPNYETAQYRETIGDILEFLYETVDEEYAEITAKIILQLLREQGIENFDNTSNAQFINIANSFLNESIANPEFTTACGISYALYGENFPDWSSVKKRAWSIYSAISTNLHLVLDIIGLVPVGGEIADLTNGVLYTVEGDALNATLSYAGAIPFAGWGGNKRKVCY
jgi:hypothetical protein